MSVLSPNVRGIEEFGSRRVCLQGVQVWPDGYAPVSDRTRFTQTDRAGVRHDRA
jgi:hypothetical protein